MNYKDYREQREIERLKQVKDKPIERDYSHLLGNKNGAKAIAKGEGIEHTVLRKTLNEYRKISIRKQNLMDRVKEGGIYSPTISHISSEGHSNLEKDLSDKLVQQENLIENLNNHLGAICKIRQALYNLRNDIDIMDAFYLDETYYMASRKVNNAKTKRIVGIMVDKGIVLPHISTHS